MKDHQKYFLARHDSGDQLDKLVDDEDITVRRALTKNPFVNRDQLEKLSKDAQPSVSNVAKRRLKK